MAKEFFDQSAVTMTDSYKFGVGLGASNAMKTITYAALKALLAAISWTFSGTITFSNNIVMGSNKITGLGDGSAAQDAVTKGQLDTKQDTLSGFTTDILLTWDGAELADGILKQNRTINALNVPELTAAPSDSADAMGDDGDFGYYDEYFYLKTSAHGWLKSARYTTF